MRPTVLATRTEPALSEHECLRPVHGCTRDDRARERSIIGASRRPHLRRGEV